MSVFSQDESHLDNEELQPSVNKLFDFQQLFLSLITFFELKELDIEEEFSNDYDDGQVIDETSKHHGHNLLRISGSGSSHLRNLAHASLLSETKEARKLRL